MAGFFISASIFFALNKLFPVPGTGEYDEVDYFGTFTSQELAKWGVIPCEQAPVAYGDDGSESQVQETFDKKE